MNNEGGAFVCGMVVVIVGLVVFGLMLSTLDDVQVRDLDDLLSAPTYIVTVDGRQFVCATAPNITSGKVVLRDCNFLKSDKAAYIGYSSVNVETRMPEGAE